MMKRKETPGPPSIKVDEGTLLIAIASGLSANPAYANYSQSDQVIIEKAISITRGLIDKLNSHE